MDVFDAIKKRRSIRKFSAIRVDIDTLEKLVECARLAPSGMNRHNFEYIIVNVKELCAEIFTCTEWKNYSFESGPMKGEEPTAYITVLSKGTPASTANDVGFAIENILLCATGEGLGGCCLGAINRNTIARILNIPKNYYVAYLVALGFPKQKSIVVDEDNEKIKNVGGIINVSKPPLSNIIHKNGF